MNAQEAVGAPHNVWGSSKGKLNSQMRQLSSNQCAL
eukprot:CAMPEP_0114627398 /NCGR_PEP_ID=MMETSP0168-20121206/12276_1 /TAXON_ID=95228 ORGANISM="Vannella sp., Strain DIVA3 517/6/12" /NCGR_SAMPLE_ID=MMETSP0168 /ASSEMBLY_ACC=CAM_ASM_000044 /LENGTH=35 /DNA_ID= /DNA_START= /DNA_END= /DNA_ORIENTATION=